VIYSASATVAVGELGVQLHVPLRNAIVGRRSFAFSLKKGKKIRDGSLVLWVNVGKYRKYPIH